MEILIEGYRRFRSREWPERRATYEAMERALADATADAQTDRELEAVKLSLGNLLNGRFAPA